MRETRPVALISAVMVSREDGADYVPLQISVVRYEDGVVSGVLDSMINPQARVAKDSSVPLYLTDELLSVAPTVGDIAFEAAKLVDGCEVSGEHAEDVLSYIEQYAPLCIER